MLVQSLIPASIDNSFVFNPHIDNQGCSFDWMLSEQSSQNCFPCSECTQDIYGKSVLTVEKKTEDIFSLSLPNSKRLSTFTAMSRSSTPLSVYYRKKLQKKPPAICQAQRYNCDFAGGSDSAVSSESHYGASVENAVSVDVETGGFQSLLKLSTKSENEGFVSKSGSCNECPDAIDPCSDEAFRIDTGRGLEHCSVDDSCSSSKLNMEIISASLKAEVDDAGECSSSGALVSEGMWDNMSEKDIFISIYRSQGFLEKESCQQDQSSFDRNCMISEARACRVCDHSESTLKMLICDHCEDAFHTSCCDPPVKRIPLHEWFCYSCLKKKHKMLVEKNHNFSATISNDNANVELSPILLMVKDCETYYSRVRVGSGYQAVVPNWSGPVIDEIHSLDEPKEMTELEYLNMGFQNFIPTPALSSIGNWLQCQAVIHDVGEGIDGTICGKWRRAPLFEVQTDHWECFSTVLWDASHADCAVPQELPTDEVLKQLKYIEMLRPRLAAKKRKLDLGKTIGSHDSKEAS